MMCKNEVGNEPTTDELKAVMSYLGKRGGKARASIPGEMSKLGKARAASLSPARRKEIARKASKAAVDARLKKAIASRKAILDNSNADSLPVIEMSDPEIISY